MPLEVYQNHILLYDLMMPEHLLVFWPTDLDFDYTDMLWEDYEWNMYCTCGQAQGHLHAMSYPVESHAAGVVPATNSNPTALFRATKLKKLNFCYKIN